MAQYSVNNYTVENLLGFIKAGDIAIPEIQRPFVWDGSKVRDLLDSLYQGYRRSKTFMALHMKHWTRRES